MERKTKVRVYLTEREDRAAARAEVNTDTSGGPGHRHRDFLHPFRPNRLAAAAAARFGRYARAVRTVLALLLAALVAAPLPLLAPATSPAATLEEKQEEARRVQEQLDAMKKESEELAREYSIQMSELETLRFSITENRRRLERAKAEYEQAKKTLGERLRAMYILGDVNMVEVLLEATSMDDMLNRMDYLRYISGQDVRIFDRARELRTEIAMRQRDLEDQEARQRQKVALIQQKQAELEASLKAQQALLDSLNAEIMQLLYQMAASSSSSGGPVNIVINGPFVFPVKGAHAFWDTWHAPRDGGRRLHKGCDVMAPMGTPLVACVNGTITLVAEGGNAGKYIRLTMEGSSTFFYYMHMQDITVSQGQKVRAGDLVGHVGDTGNARGGAPHLHFEVHPDGGEAVNPYPLLKRFDR